MNETPITGLILAGGASSRMGRPKALLKIGGQSYLDRTFETLRAGGCENIVVVTGAHHQAITRACPPGLQIVQNHQWPDGMRSSLRKGMAAIDFGPIILTHVDRPGLRASTVQALLNRSGSRPVVPIYRGQAGHPVLLPGWMRNRLLKNDDTPLNEILRRHRPLNLSVGDPGVALNVNTPEEHAIFLSTTHKTPSHACIETRSV